MLNSILDLYISGKLIPRAEELGRDKPDPNLENTIFFSRIEDNSKINNKLIMIFLIVILITFCLIIFLIMYYISDKNFVLALIGGEGLSIMFLIKTIHNFYKEKVFSDLLLYMIPQITNESEKKKFIELLKDFLKNKL